MKFWKMKDSVCLLHLTFVQEKINFMVTSIIELPVKHALFYPLPSIFSTFKELLIFLNNLMNILNYVNNIFDIPDNPDICNKWPQKVYNVALSYQQF